jgi:hypothetical protein
MTRFQLVGRVVGLLAVLLFARVGHATPIIYDEGVSGDLGDTFPATQFTLDIGSNTITGTTHFTVHSSLASVDFDHFAFAVPTGMHVTDNTYAFLATPVPGTMSAGVDYRLDNGNALPVAPLLGDVTVDMLGASLVHPFGTALPLGAGTYTLDQFLMGFSPSGDFGFSTNYTWTLSVASDAAVPEPTSVCLLGTGVAGAWMRRRRRTCRAQLRNQTNQPFATIVRS